MKRKKEGVLNCRRGFEPVIDRSLARMASDWSFNDNVEKIGQREKKFGVTLLTFDRQRQATFLQTPLFSNTNTHTHTHTHSHAHPPTLSYSPKHICAYTFSLLCTHTHSHTLSLFLTHLSTCGQTLSHSRTHATEFRLPVRSHHEKTFFISLSPSSSLSLSLTHTHAQAQARNKNTQRGALLRWEMFLLRSVKKKSAKRLKKTLQGIKRNKIENYYFFLFFFLSSLILYFFFIFFSNSSLKEFFILLMLGVELFYWC